jgi:hypothetical protein
LKENSMLPKISSKLSHTPLETAHSTQKLQQRQLPVGFFKNFMNIKKTCTPWSRVLLANRFSANPEIPTFHGIWRCSLPHLQVPTTCPYPEHQKDTNIPIYLIKNFHKSILEVLCVPLTLSLLKPRYLVQPFNVIKWQLAFNSAGQGLSRRVNYTQAT